MTLLRPGSAIFRDEGFSLLRTYRHWPQKIDVRLQVAVLQWLTLFAGLSGGHGPIMRRRQIAQGAQKGRSMNGARPEGRMRRPEGVRIGSRFAGVKQGVDILTAS